MHMHNYSWGPCQMVSLMLLQAELMGCLWFSIKRLRRGLLTLHATKPEAKWANTHSKVCVLMQPIGIRNREKSGSRNDTVKMCLCMRSTLGCVLRDEESVELPDVNKGDYDLLPLCVLQRFVSTTLKCTFSFVCALCMGIPPLWSWEIKPSDYFHVEKCLSCLSMIKQVLISI